MLSEDQEPQEVSATHVLTMLGILLLCLAIWVFIIWGVIVLWEFIAPLLPFLT